MLKIAATVVLYNPGIEVIENINTFITQVEIVYAIDNSDEPLDKNVVSELIAIEKVKYIRNSTNIGLASALNKAAFFAIEEGYDLLLTMDQDSSVSEKFVSKMLNEFDHDSKIGILAPFIIHEKNPLQPESDKITDISAAMTSGSVIRLSAYVEAGGFLEKLFIDYVDNEFCLRMKSSGYKIMQLNSVSLHHRLGDVTRKRLVFKDVFPTNHSPLRLYYRTRNRLYLYRQYKEEYPEYIRSDKKSLIKELIKIFMFESNKFEKFRMIARGFMDYRKNIYGPYFNVKK